MTSPIYVRIVYINIYIFFSAVWARYIVARPSPGWFRLLLASPVVLLNCFVPLIFDKLEEYTIFLTYLLILVWLSNFKIIALAFDRGSLIGSKLSLFQFCTLYALPITAQTEGNKSYTYRVKKNDRFGDKAGSFASLISKWVLKLTLMVGIVYLLSTDPDWLPPLLGELAEAFMLYWFLGVLMDGPAALIGWVTGLHISPHFDAPYLSASHSEFWSHRWNLTVGNMLRYLCYDPVYEGRVIATEKPYTTTDLRRAAATCWTFFVSGVMHEFLIWYIDPKAATGEWLAYFTLQGPLILLEAILKKFFRARGVHSPKALKVVLTVGLQLIMGHFLFFPPCHRTRLDERFYNDVKKNTVQFYRLVT